MSNLNINYRPADNSIWTGRTDGTEPAHLRWHQIISFVDLREAVSLEGKHVFLGFPVDEGVKRNKGRIGAAEGSLSLRKTLVNLPVQREFEVNLADAGDIICIDGDLESAQAALAEAVAIIIQKGGFPIVLGGGHEVTYGHYNGVKAGKQGKVGIINFDAHFDLRAPEGGVPTSGTGFHQIATDEKAAGSHMDYLAIGIQRISNTEALFDTAYNFGVDYIEAKDFHHMNNSFIEYKLQSFLDRIDHLYITVDLDVFAAAYAPGVSATAFNGIIPDVYFKLALNQLMASPKFASIDFAELNPTYDIDSRTAKLAADLVYSLVNR